MYSEVQCIMGNGHMETPLINESLKFKGHFLFEMQTDMGLTDGHLIVSFICRVFFEMHKNGNNANIDSRGFTTWKQKIQWKMLPLVGIEPKPLITSDSKFNTLLSELSWHLLVRLKL